MEPSRGGLGLLEKRPLFSHWSQLELFGRYCSRIPLPTPPLIALQKRQTSRRCWESIFTAANPENGILGL